MSWYTEQPPTLAVHLWLTLCHLPAGSTTRTSTTGAITWDTEPFQATLLSAVCWLGRHGPSITVGVLLWLSGNGTWVATALDRLRFISYAIPFHWVSSYHGRSLQVCDAVQEEGICVGRRLCWEEGVLEEWSVLGGEAVLGGGGCVGRSLSEFIIARVTWAQAHSCCHKMISLHHDGYVTSGSGIESKLFLFPIVLLTSIFSCFKDFFISCAISFDNFGYSRFITLKYNKFTMFKFRHYVRVVFKSKTLNNPTTHKVCFRHLYGIFWN